MNLNLKQELLLRQTVEAKNEFLQLAKLYETCSSKKEAQDILIADNNYHLIYGIEATNLEFINRSYYHFVRLRIAFFQDDYLWFEQESSNLIEYWLSNLGSFNLIFNDASILFFKDGLNFHQHPIFFNFSVFLNSPKTFANTPHQNGNSVSVYLRHLLVEKKKMLNQIRAK